MPPRCSAVTATSRRNAAGRWWNEAWPDWSPRTATAPRGRRIWTRRMSSQPRGSGSARCLSSTAPRWEWLRSHRLHLVQRRQAPERLQLDLTDTLARQAEPAADLLEGLRLGVVESVAEHEDLALSLLQRQKRGRQGL